MIHHSYSIEIDGHTFPMPFNDETGTIDDTATLYISKDGQRTLITALCQDTDCTDSFDYHEGEFIQFDRRSIHDGYRPEPDTFKRIIRDNPGRVFTVDFCSSNHGPGTASCGVKAGPFSVSDTKGIIAKAGGRIDSASTQAINDADGYYIIPDDVPPERRQDYAAATLANYAQWCNGDCYGLVRWTYTLDGDTWEEADRDEVWGFIGREYAEQNLQEELQYYLDKLEVIQC